MEKQGSLRFKNIIRSIISITEKNYNLSSTFFVAIYFAHLC